MTYKASVCDGAMCPARFIVTIPEGFPLEAAGPVFCAGITMYSPLVYWKVGYRRRRRDKFGGRRRRRW